MKSSINRPNKTQYYLDIALAISRRSTCLKRHYGAVIVTNDEIVSTGYNGSPRGFANCCDTGNCARMHEKRNSNYEACKSVHAEQNALISASRKESFGGILYLACEYLKDGEWVEDTTMEVQPCPICQRMLLNAGITKVVTRFNSKF